MEHSEDEGLTLSTGKEIKAHCDIVGIDPGGEVFGGYDDAHVDAELTPTERVELADYMLAKWREYRERQGADG